MWYKKCNMSNVIISYTPRCNGRTRGGNRSQVLMQQGAFPAYFWLRVGVIFRNVSLRELGAALQMLPHKAVGLVWVWGGQEVGSCRSDVADDGRRD